MTASGTGRRSRRATVAVGLVALGAGVGLLVGRESVEEAIREVTLPLRHDDIIQQQAKEKDLDPALIAAVIYAESRFREQISDSEAGARGLMQVTPETAQDIANCTHVVTDCTRGEEFVPDDLYDADVNIRYGAFHLRDLLDRYGGNLVAALAAYNAGAGNVDEWGGAELEVEDIRFSETRAYVDEVLEKRDEYQASYADDLGIDG